MAATSPDTPAGLTDQQAQFCREYLLDFSAAKAARRSGYAASTIAGGYLYSELLANVGIRTEIVRLVKARAERTLLSADRVVLELAAIAFSNHSNYVQDDSGDVLVGEDVDPIAHQAVASVRKKVRRLGKGPDRIEESEVEVKLWDKVQALKLLMLHLGMVEKKLTVAGDPDRPLKVDGKHEHEHRAGLPADGTLLECLRRLGLPVAPGVRPDGQ